MAATGDLRKRLVKVVEVWIDLFARHDLLTYASAVAFQVLKSLIPLALLGLALIEIVGRPDVWSDHLGPAIANRVDPPAYHAVDFAVEKIFSHDSVPVVIFAGLLTVWYVSGAIRAIIGAINRAYEAKEDRPFWIRWSISFGLAFCIVPLVVGAILLVVAVPKSAGGWEAGLVATRWIGAFVALSLAAGLLVRLGPAQRRSKRWATAGGVLVVLSWVVLSLVFRWYVSSLANFKTAVGQLTVFIVLLVYVYASSIVFLVGVELDEQLREAATADERGVLDVLFGIGR